MARMSSLSDDELQRVVTEDRDSWSAEALDVAQLEIKARGLIVPAQMATPRADHKPPMLKWGAGIGVALLALKVILLLLRG